MKQKKIWMTYLTIGISLIMIVSCRKTVGYLLSLNHNYVNQTNHDLTMEIYNQISAKKYHSTELCCDAPSYILFLLNGGYLRSNQDR